MLRQGWAAVGIYYYDAAANVFGLADFSVPGRLLPPCCATRTLVGLVAAAFSFGSRSLVRTDDERCPGL